MTPSLFVAAGDGLRVRLRKRFVTEGFRTPLSVLGGVPAAAGTR